MLADGGGGDRLRLGKREREERRAVEKAKSGGHEADGRFLFPFTDHRVLDYKQMTAQRLSRN